jgi:hypothetical protein
MGFGDYFGSLGWFGFGLKRLGCSSSPCILVNSQFVYLSIVTMADPILESAILATVHHYVYLAF